ncbi:MAG: T9SS C-terminal target domain-containing protein [Cytophagales bacterium]|nr:MAG: T9SS C-terminal target domain-containing protein [Cytophagales bacterium]
MKKYTFFISCHNSLWQGFETFLLTFLIIICGIAQSKAQSGNNDATFVPRDNSGRNFVGFAINPTSDCCAGEVRKIIIQSDGKILVGGNFQNFAGDFAMAGARAGRIARLNPDGLNDATFNTGNGFNTGFNVVHTMALQPDGKVLVGGRLDNYNGIAADNMVRLNADGTLDRSFNNVNNILKGLDGYVYAIAVQADGKIIVGGQFTAYNGSTSTPANRAFRIIRLNTDGTRDATFNIGTGFNSASIFQNEFMVYTLSLQTDGKIIVGGDFTDYNGTPSRKIVRLNADGSRDATFNIGTGFGINDKVYALALQPDGKVLVGGNFTSYNGAGANHFIRLNANGSRDASFNIGTASNNPVRDIALQADGKVIAVGEFTSFNGAVANRLVRLNTDGTRDATFNIGTGFSHDVFTVAIQPDGKAVVGGVFSTFDGIVRNGITRLGGVPSVPTVAITGTLTPFITCAGTPSATQTYTVSGTNLSANIAINAPTGFEISSNGTSFGNTLTLNATNGVVANTTITVRLAANATGSPSGNITHTSSTASQNVAVSGTVNLAPTITLGAIPSATTAAISVGIPYTAVTGSPNQYSITVGTNTLAGFVAVSNQALPASPINLVLPATKTAGTYNFNLTVRNSTTGCISALVSFSLTVGTPPPPVLTITGTLSPLSACAGQSFVAQNYTISGTNLAENITVTAPAGIEVSSDAGTTYSNSLVLSPSAGTLATTTIRVRLSAAATGSLSGNITHTSGSVTQNVAVSGTVSPLPTLTVGMIPSINTRSTSFTIPYTATTGSPNQFSLTTGANAMPNFVAITNQALTASPIVIQIPQNAVVGNYNFNLIVRNSAIGCESTVIPIVLNNVMSVVDEEFSGKITIYPNPTESAITIQFPIYSKIDALRLLNPLGQEIMTLGKQTNPQLQLDLTTYPAGIYYLYIIEDKKVGIKKIILTK